MTNWRSCHGYPINTFQGTLRQKLNSVDTDAIVAQRLKRMPSIIGKLHRFPNMQLARMQDIGGLRAVVPTLAKARALEDNYRNSRFMHVLVASHDYIDAPKSSGYRSIYLIYRYKNSRSPQYDGLLLELQICTQLQHAWATAVETVGIFTGQALKSNLGSEDWKRFFALMGTAIAMREKATLVPNTPTTRKDLVSELRACVTKLDAQTKLKNYSSVLQLPRHVGLKEAAYYLLELNPTAKTIGVTSYKQKDLKQASEDYLNVERTLGARPESMGAQAVLVSVGSLASLKRAYPNYFLDMRVFIDEVARALTYSSG